jgi:hypothetical protein
MLDIFESMGNDKNHRQCDFEINESGFAIN